MGQFRFSQKQRAYLVFKRAMDIVLSLLFVVLFWWALLILALITKASSKGPILFKQKRMGKNQKEFWILKFRTMKIDAPFLAPGDSNYFSINNYVTKWGSFMRITGLDELPQIFNILLGDMSFIGPRPNQTFAYEESLIRERLFTNPNAYEVRPGIIGYAQAKMGREVDLKRKAQYDSVYVATIGPLIDLRIIFLSFGLFSRLLSKKR